MRDWIALVFSLALLFAAPWLWLLVLVALLISCALNSSFKRKKGNDNV